MIFYISYLSRRLGPDLQVGSVCWLSLWRSEKQRSSRCVIGRIWLLCSFAKPKYWCFTKLNNTLSGTGDMTGWKLIIFKRNRRVKSDIFLLALSFVFLLSDFSLSLCAFLVRLLAPHTHVHTYMFVYRHFACESYESSNSRTPPVCPIPIQWAFCPHRNPSV